MNEKPKSVTESEEQAPDVLRREFIRKYGRYAAGSAIGIYLLMSPENAKASIGSGDNPGSSGQ